MSDLLGAHAAPLEFEHAGRVYRATPVTQEVKTRVERWLRKLAYEDLYAQREDLPAEMYQDALASLQINRARYAYLGEVFMKELPTERGAVGLTAILLQATEEEARRLIEERPADTQAMVQELILTSMPREAEQAARAKLRAMPPGGAPPGVATPAAGASLPNSPAPASNRPPRRRRS